MFDRIEIDCRVFPKAHVKVFDEHKLVHEFKRSDFESVIEEVIENIPDYEQTIDVLRFFVENRELCMIDIGDGKSIITLHLNMPPDARERGQEAQKTEGGTVGQKKEEIAYTPMASKERSELLERYVYLARVKRDAEKEQAEIRDKLKPALDKAKADKLFFETIGGHKIQLMRQTRVGALQVPKIKAKYGATDDDIEALRGADSVSWVIKENT